MLRTRIITALVLLAVLLPALFYPDPRPFCVVALLMIAGGVWEWGRLNQLGQGASVALALLGLALCAGSWAAGWLQQPALALWAPVGAAWVLVGLWLIRRGIAGWAPIPVALRVVGGLLALCLAWLAVAQARVIGINFLLSVLTLVWMADVGAYAAGRTFGKRKLASAISPGKSWEGVYGGVVGVLLLAACWIWAEGGAGHSLYSRIWAFAPWLLPLALLFLCATSVVGDLIESLIKRSAGVKDSSGLLPGHGGVLDRVDALLPTLPLALMLYCVAA
ncbi:phosphatidate cytidylyltransferase [Pseudorhodoferax sp. Leaf267]|uniref:phosphatidate cytidylyltransferase n=1 Tax=Pseudorhodoferax sp. Leaf267 TaxID=1736316 RepID=UPI0006FF14EE|nr:phosphatidate cytidylyltransferase [Pseudorhodoferax sp. Leaf267]KQP17732.1 phosphatidate cytidylyltransferase [Pseudorhodoferax sp. Leaf267]